jgi:hypothetical protein
LVGDAGWQAHALRSHHQPALQPFAWQLPPPSGLQVVQHEGVCGRSYTPQVPLTPPPPAPPVPPPEPPLMHAPMIGSQTVPPVHVPQPV